MSTVLDRATDIPENKSIQSSRGREVLASGIGMGQAPKALDPAVSIINLDEYNFFLYWTIMQIYRLIQ